MGQSFVAKKAIGGTSKFFLYLPVRARAGGVCPVDAPRHWAYAARVAICYRIAGHVKYAAKYL